MSGLVSLTLSFLIYEMREDNSIFLIVLLRGLKDRIYIKPLVSCSAQHIMNAW